MKFPPFKNTILYENQDVIVVNKPPFLPALDERSGEGLSVKQLAKTYHPGAQLCHRLDKETSGALIIAKNADAYRDISMQFEKRTVKKVYHAVVEGLHEFDQLPVDLPIRNLGKDHVKISRREGKNAETLFNSIRYYRHYTLMECRPVTGRMHQIRIHLATQKAVIAGDELYGGNPVYLSKLKRNYTHSKYKEEQSVIKRFALHAFRVGFRLPEGEDITVEAPYPKDFAVLIRLLEKFDS